MAQSWWGRAVSRFGDPQGIVRFYVLVGGLCMLALCWLTPPLQVPDEPQHFYRSYQLSRFEIRPEVRDGQAGAMLPDTLPVFAQQQMGSLAHHQSGRKPPQRTLRATLQGLDTPTDPQRQHFVEFSGAALYAPVGYVPQAVGMAVGRALDFSPLGLLYAGRCANAVAAIALTAWALSLLSVGRLFGLVVALLPMTQFMTASLSPDALTIAGGFVVAGCLQRFFDDGRWHWGRHVAWLAGGLLLCAVKVVYLPVLAACAIGLFGRQHWANPARRRAVLWQALGIVTVVAAIGLWFWWRAAGAVGGGGPPGTDAGAQVAYLREQLLRPLRIVIRSLYMEGDFLWETMIGRLGWLNVKLLPVLHVVAAAALVLSLLENARRSRPGRWASGFLLVLIFVCVSLIELALYVAWTPVGEYSATGVQGRYFTPMLPLVGLALAWRTSSLATPAGARQAATAVRGLLLLLSAGMLAVVVAAYSLF